MNPDALLSGASECRAKHLLLRDIAVIVALFPCLFVSGWLGLHLTRLLLSVISIRHFGIYAGLVSFPLDGVVRGVFHFLCGYLLARLLRRVNPWHVLGGLAIVVALVIVGATPWTELAEFAALSETTVPIFLFDSIIGPLCLLLFLSLGVWWQRQGGTPGKGRG